MRYESDVYDIGRGGEQNPYALKTLIVSSFTISIYWRSHPEYSMDYHSNRNGSTHNYITCDSYVTMIHVNGLLFSFKIINNFKLSSSDTWRDSHSLCWMCTPITEKCILNLMFVIHYLYLPSLHFWICFHFGFITKTKRNRINGSNLEMIGSKIYWNLIHSKSNISWIFAANLWAIVPLRNGKSNRSSFIVGWQRSQVLKIR